MGAIPWSAEEMSILEDKWGTVSVKGIANLLKRPVGGVINKKVKMGLGPFLQSGDYITVNQLYIALGRTGGGQYALQHWINDQHMPVKYKLRHNNKYRVIYLDDFWKWAEEYRMWINFAKVEPNILGEEPDWVAEQRRADIEFSKYKTTPWTEKEDALLKSYLKMFKYTYRDLSIQMKRTMGAIKRRMIDLGIKERPLREPPHSPWTEDEVNTVIEMYNKGYRSAVIQEYINKSGQAIEGKIERLIKEGYLTKWK
jgi:hypothetical protein